MTIRIFVDTNVLVYTQDFRNPTKQKAAANWIESAALSAEIVVSPQVLNEFVSVLVVKTKLYTSDEAKALVENAREWCKASTSFPTTLEAFELRARLGYSWWDSLLLSSATRASCSIFLSEDLSHFQRVGALRIVNPFLVRPDEILSNG